MELLALLHQDQSRWHGVLVGALVGHRLPLNVHLSRPAEQLPQALSGLGPLGFRGALIEHPAHQQQAVGLVAALETEAQMASRCDFVLPERLGLRGYYLEALALSRLLLDYCSGLNLLWLGQARPELALGLRGPKQVAVAAPLPSEAEALMSKIPHSQRGLLTPLAQAQVLSRRADVVLYTGGKLPLEALQAYHTLIALVEPPKEALRLVGQYLGPTELPKYLLSQALEALGHPLPPDAFS